MNTDNPGVVKLQKQVQQLEQIVKVLGNKVALLERENNRRKMEVGQIALALRK
jgi:hypothetical protein